MNDIPPIAPEFLELHAWLNERFEKNHHDRPGLCWYGGGGFMHLEFMAHHFGCWALLFVRMSGGEAGRINIGTFTNKEDIEVLISALKLGQREEEKLPEPV